MTNCGYNGNDRTTSLTYERYPHGSTLWGWDLTYDKCASADLHKGSIGSIELEISWENPLPNPITIIVYAAFNSRVIVENIKQPAIVELI